MTPQRIRRKYYLLSGAHTLAASLIWGVNTLFLLDVGLSLTQVFLANASYTFAATLFEIPTGAVADSRGRRVSLQWSSLMLFVGTLGYLAAGTWGGGLPAIVAASVVLGLGFTFFSGAAEAWAVDELAAAGEESAGADLFAEAGTASGVMMLAGTIGGGLLASLDYRIPYIGRAVLFLFMFGLTTFAMPENAWKPDGRTVGPVERIRKTAVDSMKYGLASRGLRLLLLLAFLTGIFGMWSFYALQPYVTSLAGKPGAAWLSGLVVAGITFSRIVGNLTARRFPGARSVADRMIRGTLLAAFGALIAGLAGLGPVRDLLGPGAPFAAVAGLMLMMGASGFVEPFQRQALHERARAENRATVVSLESLTGSGGAIIGQPALGWFGGRFGIGAGYVAVCGILLALQPVLAILKRDEQRTDPNLSPVSDGQ